MQLPPCGLYRTTEPIGPVLAGRLVYFHNHGEPGPGIYLPESWTLNRARFAAGGTPLESSSQAFTLQALLPEGLYRVQEEFVCCSRRCRTYEPGLLVQLGYDGHAAPILFVPEWGEEGLRFPERGTRLEEDRLAHLEPLTVPGRVETHVSRPQPTLH